VPKYISLLRRADGENRATYHSNLLQAGRELAHMKGVERLIIDLVDVPPEEAGLRPGGQPAFDAVLELWTADDATADSCRLAIQESAGGEANLYRASEFIERDYDRTWPDGEVSPGIKSFYLALKRADITHEQMARHWGETHAPLALKHHVGMWRYARNVFDEALTPDAPNWDGVAELHFRSSDDLINRFYDSDEGRAVIAADIAKFSGGGRALHTHEYILHS
jgi:uncharacterized protein (TIGR02118 family)